jgi:hypothetical protein
MVVAPLPSAVESKLEALILGSLSREDADVWAAQWVKLPASPQMHPAIWRALTRIAGCDLRHGPGGEYLHDDMQIINWLAEFRDGLREFDDSAV